MQIIIIIIIIASILTPNKANVCMKLFKGCARKVSMCICRYLPIVTVINSNS